MITLYVVGVGDDKKGAKLQVSPDTGAHIILRLSIGTRVQAVATLVKGQRNTVWYKVQYKGKLGYVQSNQLSRRPQKPKPGLIEVPPATPTPDHGTTTPVALPTVSSSPPTTISPPTASAPAPGSIISTGTAILHGTWLFDLDAGAEGNSGDIWWEQQTSTVRQMTPRGNAAIVNLGGVDFDAVSFSTLRTLAYSSTPISGNNDSTNQLVTGDLFAVHTNGGNYAKVQIVTYGYDLVIRWVTYRGAA